MTSLALVLTFGLMLALPAAARAEPLDEQSKEGGAAPETRDCLALSAVRQTKVVDGQTIDFILRDGSVWRNKLPFICPQLNFERAFSYQTPQTQLCRQDIISVIQQTGSTPVAARCGLGRFVRQPPATTAKPGP